MGRAGRRTALTVAACAALLLAGCTSARQGPDEPEPDGSSPAPITSGPSPSDGGDDSAGPTPRASATDTSPDTAEPTGGGETFVSVTDLRVGAHDGYDRVVFDLDGTGSGTPGWRVEYVDQALDDGSGEAVRVDGDAILRVSLSGTAMPMDSGVDEFSGDRIEPPGTQSIDEIVYRSWFEGYTTAFIGVDEAERPFRVFLLEDPLRVVVDVRH